MYMDKCEVLTECMWIQSDLYFTVYDKFTFGFTSKKDAGIML